MLKANIFNCAVEIVKLYFDIKWHNLYEGKGKVLCLAYVKLRTSGHWVGSPDRSWCHRHTTSMIRLFCSQPMAPWASAAAYGKGEKHTHMLLQMSMEPWALTKKALSKCLLKFRSLKWSAIVFSIVRFILNSPIRSLSGSY
jgi:hypothetical protein